jgi:hypothetical protein
LAKITQAQGSAPCTGRQAGAAVAVGSETSCPKSEVRISTAVIGRCFANYSESIQIIGGKLKIMLKKMFLVSPEQLKSMKGGVNKRQIILLRVIILKRNKKGRSRLTLTKAAAGLD